MKITKEQLKRLIKEEMDSMLGEVAKEEPEVSVARHSSNSGEVRWFLKVNSDYFYIKSEKIYEKIKAQRGLGDLEPYGNYLGNGFTQIDLSRKSNVEYLQSMKFNPVKPREAKTYFGSQP